MQPQCVALKKKPNADQALLILEKLASQVKPILNNHNWTIKNLCEFYPTNPNLLGVNVNRGWKVNLRLRYPYDENSFLEYEDILGTLLHEMVHIVRGPHDEQFYRILQELKTETELLMASGYTGEGFYSSGQSLGSRSVARHLSKQVSAAAAEKRLQTSKIMLPTGGLRLGGSPLQLKNMTPAQLAANAAEKRLRDQIWCGGSIDESKRKNSNEITKVETKRSRVTIDLTNEESTVMTSEWSCPTCTFINKSLELVCQVCLSINNQNTPVETSDWNCPQCTLKNSQTTKVCDACAFVKFII
ncbi:WLM domain-containing protein, partial [Thamnidium elegans]